MSRLLQILLIGTVGYWVIKNRFRVMNFILSNRWIRSFVVSQLMNVPFVRKNMMGAVFSPRN